jgi:pyruvate dehydrogenase E1 component alpha subunit
MSRIDLMNLYRRMYGSRIFEEHVVRLWNDGMIHGEMHTSIGEEAIYAGVVGQLEDGDAMALDHRGTSPSVIRGLDPKALLLEFMGHPDGICSGMGGHMHIFSKEHLAASSGIVGASGPAAVGFAMAARHLRPGKLAVAFFGEGAFNQGMMMESMNMASALRLPVLFVCKDSGMAITTVSKEVTAGDLVKRAAAFDIPAVEVDGSDVEKVWPAAGEAIGRARSGAGPSFILAKCHRPDGHFLGDPLHRIVKNPVRELAQISGPLMKAAASRKGASLKERAGSVKDVLSLIRKKAGERSEKDRDPIVVMRNRLVKRTAELIEIDRAVEEEMGKIAEDAVKLVSEYQQE